MGANTPSHCDCCDRDMIRRWDPALQCCDLCARCRAAGCVNCCHGELHPDPRPIVLELSHDEAVRLLNGGWVAGTLPVRARLLEAWETHCRAAWRGLAPLSPNHTED